MAEATQVPWPEWLLRYLACDNEESFEDLIWSVGGSPPYGGVSYEEGAAVYELLEKYRGPGKAPEGAYQKLRGFIAKVPDRLDALETFIVMTQS
jgi:hypothetical protein